MSSLSFLFWLQIQINPNNLHVYFYWVYVILQALVELTFIIQDNWKSHKLLDRSFITHL
jgi:hypothetical protein